LHLKFVDTLKYISNLARASGAQQVVYIAYVESSDLQIREVRKVSSQSLASMIT